MRTLTRISFLLALVAAGAFAGDQYLIRTPIAKIGAVAARHGLTVVRTYQGSASGLFVAETTPDSDVRSMVSDPDIQSFARNGRLNLPEIASPAWLGASAQLPNLTKPAAVNFFGSTALGSYVNQPATLLVALGAARTFNVTGAGTVAILDTGVDANHPVLKGSLVAGYDFTRDCPGGSEMPDLDQSTTAILDELQSTTAILDKTQAMVLNQSTTAILDQSTTAILDGSKLPPAFGHGTMVAGLVHLVAPTAKIMPVKVFSGDGSTTIAQIVAGIHWAVDNKADVINMSFSTTERVQELADAIDYATSNGVICVASAGNEGSQIMVYPAAYGIIGVGSTDRLMRRSSFSNYGAVVSLAAPGEGVVTLYPGNNYAAGWGTSFSTPFVAGGAALLMQLGPGDNQVQAARALSQAVPIAQQLGAGELNLFFACLYQATHSN